MTCTDRRRDDDRRRGALAAGRRWSASSASGCRPRRPTWPAVARAEPGADLRVGPIGAKPNQLPLSIGDGVLGTTADVVSVPEMFNYWLQPGRIDVGFLGAAQLDRYANINTTVIGGDYTTRRCGCPAPAAHRRSPPHAGRSRHRPAQRRAFVERLEFVTSVGYGSGPGDRERLGLRGAGPTRVITDLGVLEPDPRPASSPSSPSSRCRRRYGPSEDRLGAAGRRPGRDHTGADRRGAARAAWTDGRGSAKERSGMTATVTTRLPPARHHRPSGCAAAAPVPRLSLDRVRGADPAAARPAAGADRGDRPAAGRGTWCHSTPT